MDILSYILASGTGGGGGGGAEWTTEEKYVANWNSQKKGYFSKTGIGKSCLIIVQPNGSISEEKFDDFCIEFDSTSYVEATDNLTIYFKYTHASSSSNPGSVAMKVTYVKFESDFTKPIVVVPTTYSRRKLFNSFKYKADTIWPSDWTFSSGAWKADIILSGMTANGFALIAPKIYGTAAQSNVEAWNKYGVHVDHIEDSCLCVRLASDDKPEDGMEYELIWAPVNPININYAFAMASNAPSAGSDIIDTQVVIPKAAWHDGYSTISVSEVSSTSHVDVSPEASSFKEYCECGVRCVQNLNGQLQFQCDTQPTNNLYVAISVR